MSLSDEVDRLAEVSLQAMRERDAAREELAELRARIVQQGRNRVRVQERLGVGYAELRSFVDWIETMDMDATVPMGAAKGAKGT